MNGYGVYRILGHGNDVGIEYIMERLTRIRLVSFVSSAGKGVYTARATQLPRIVSRMRNSNGFHSTI